MSSVRQQVSPRTPYDELPEWLSIEQAAVHLGCSKWFVYQSIRKGDIPHRRIGHKFIQIPKHFFSSQRATYGATAARGSCGYVEESAR